MRFDLLAALSVIGVMATTVRRADHPRRRQPRKPAPWPQEDPPTGRSLAVGTEDWKLDFATLRQHHHHNPNARAADGLTGPARLGRELTSFPAPH
jgi:hypothetical protein